MNGRMRVTTSLFSRRLRTITCALAIAGWWAPIAAIPRAHAEGAKATGEFSPERRLSKSLGEPNCFEMEVGDPDDPRTWSYDPNTWQYMGRRELTDHKEVVKVTFRGDLDGPDGLVPDVPYHVSDKQVQLLSQVESLRYLKFIQGGITARQLKTLSTHPNLQVLIFQGCGVTDEGLRWVGRMKDLRALTISYVTASAVGVKRLAGLSKLVSLDLSGCQLNDDALAALSGLRSVRFLRLKGDFTDAGLVGLAPLDSLEVLLLRVRRFHGHRGSDVHGTGLKHLTAGKLRELSVPLTMSDDGLAAVGRFTNLRKLTIGSAPVTDSGMRHLRGLHKLEWLRAESTNITGAGLENLTGLVKLKLRRTKINSSNAKSLAGLTKLRYLDLSKTPIDNVKSLAGLTKLCYLDLSFTPTDGDCLKHLKNLRDLERLILRRTKVSSDSFQHFGQLASLRMLDLSGCAEIDDKAAPMLGKATTLTHLKIDGTQITEAALPHFHRLTNLRSLDLTDMSGKIGQSEELKNLRQALPKCGIMCWGPGDASIPFVLHPDRL